MALVERRNNGTKTLCKRLTRKAGNNDIHSYLCPHLYAEFLENSGQNFSYTSLHGNCIFKHVIESYLYMYICTHIRIYELTFCRMSGLL